MDNWDNFLGSVSFLIYNFSFLISHFSFNKLITNY